MSTAELIPLRKEEHMNSRSTGAFSGKHGFFKSVCEILIYFSISPALCCAALIRSSNCEAAFEVVSGGQGQSPSKSLQTDANWGQKSCRLVYSGWNASRHLQGEWFTKGRTCPVCLLHPCRTHKHKHTYMHLGAAFSLGLKAWDGGRGMQYLTRFPINPVQRVL